MSDVSGQGRASKYIIEDLDVPNGMMGVPTTDIAGVIDTFITKFRSSNADTGFDITSISVTFWASHSLR